MASKDLDIVVKKDGSWFCSYGEITHSRVRRYFQSILSKDGESYFLDDGRQKVEVKVEGFIFFVEALREREYEGVDWLWLVLNDGTEEPLDPRTLRMLSDNSFICSVKKGKFKAKFTLSAYWQLVEHVVEKNGEFFLVVGGEAYPLRREGDG